MKPVKRTNFPFLSGWYVALASISSGGIVMCDTGTWLRHISGTRLLGKAYDGRPGLSSIYIRFKRLFHCDTPSSSEIYGSWAP